MIKTLIENNFVCVAACFFFSIFVSVNKNFSRQIVRLFRWTLACIFVLCVSDAVEYYLAQSGEPTVLHSVVCALSYCMIVTLIYFTDLIAMRHTQRMHTAAVLLGLPAMVNAIASFSSLFANIVFTISDSNEVLHGPLYFMPFVTSLFYMVILVIFMMSNYIHNDREEFVGIITFLVLDSVAVVLEVINRNFNGLMPSTCAFSVIFYYLILHGSTHNRDNLTGCLNRSRFYHDIQYRGVTALVMIDLNNLKMLNDTMGHSEGDKALITLTNTVLSCLPRGATLYRMGGDEFSILFIGEDERTVASIIDEIRKKMKQTPYSWAMGYAMNGKDITPDALCTRADGQMYTDKVKNKMKFADTQAFAVYFNSVSGGKEA